MVCNVGLKCGKNTKQGFVFKPTAQLVNGDYQVPVSCHAEFNALLSALAHHDITVKSEEIKVTEEEVKDAAAFLAVSSTS
jgi:hypothetical protein